MRLTSIFIIFGCGGDSLSLLHCRWRDGGVYIHLVSCSHIILHSSCLCKCICIGTRCSLCTLLLVPGTDRVCLFIHVGSYYTRLPCFFYLNMVGLCRTLCTSLIAWAPSAHLFLPHLHVPFLPTSCFHSQVVSTLHCFFIPFLVLPWCLYLYLHFQLVQPLFLPCCI